MAMKSLCTLAEKSASIIRLPHSKVPANPRLTESKDEQGRRQ
jgi:hypothetical protein